MEKVMLEQILEEENIAEALEDLKSKNNNCGSDGVMITELPSYWEINKKRIIKDLLGGDYQPGVVKNTEIVDYKNKRRMITILNSVDRLILRAILQKLRPVLDGKLLPCCYAFREGKGVKEAVEKTCEYLNEGCSYMAKTDIKDFFDNIDLTHMTGILDGLIHDTALARLLKKFLYVKVDDSGKISEKRKGLIQGSPLSPVFSNLYLTTFDRQIQAEGYNYCRFSDDIAIFTKTKDDAEEAFARTRQLLKEEHDLDVNVKKSGVFETLHQIYLGYRFVKEKRKKTIIAVKNRRSFDRSYDHWYTDCIKKTDRNYHIINNGILTKRDYTLLFENGSGKKYIPVETSRSINVYSKITFTSDFFKFVSEKKLCVNIFDKYGNYIGTFSGPGGYNAKVLLGQAQLYTDAAERLITAKAMEVAYVHNMRANLKYYENRTKSTRLKDGIRKLSGIIAEINEAKSTEGIMLYEARARQIYYDMFNEMMQDEKFRFSSRTRRPPKDPLNAMISLGNTYLYNRIATEVEKSPLDIRIGIVHATTSRRQTLNLDIADIFKPLIVDRVIFTLINKNMIDADKDFCVNENGGVYMSYSGKRMFINQLDEKMYRKFSEGSSNTTYDHKVREEINKIYRMVMYGEKYRPYKYY